MVASMCRGVLGHTEHPHQRPWVTIDEHVTPVLANLVGECCERLYGSESLIPSSSTGAKTSEVACMGSLTANLHTLFTSFYKPTPTRHKIMYEGKAFPSDIVCLVPPYPVLPLIRRNYSTHSHRKLPSMTTLLRPYFPSTLCQGNSHSARPRSSRLSKSRGTPLLSSASERSSTTADSALR
jgi:hypothetical protein